MTASEATRSFLLTPSGAGAIGLIRLTGPKAATILHRSFRSARAPQDTAKDADITALLAGDRIRYGKLVADDDEVVDDVLVSRVSGVGEPAFDISLHGGVRVVQRALDLFERHGCVFSRHDDTSPSVWGASNRIEREAVEALTTAMTQRAVRFLAWQRQHLAVELEAIAADCVPDPQEARARLEAMIRGCTAARTLISGATVAIVGPPNSGKSTLFNRLVGRSAAVVSPIAGTTRDWVAQSVEVDGVPITLVDTAGRHERAEWLEKRAIDAGRDVASHADASLVVLDGSQPLSSSVCTFLSRLETGASFDVVVNKVDLGRVWKNAELEGQSIALRAEPLELSAHTGQGLDRLLARLLETLEFRDWVDQVSCTFTARQHDVAINALSELSTTPTKAAKIIRDVMIDQGGSGET